MHFHCIRRALFSATVLAATAGFLPLAAWGLTSPAEPAAAPAVSPELRTVGNQVLTPAGEPVLLRGLNIPSLEWAAEGDGVFRKLEVALDEWKANVIRLPVSVKFWFGRADTRQRGAEQAYRWIVDEVVARAAARGAYVIIDYHHYRAPDEDAVLFWKDVAMRYRNHPAVIFGLFNEPHSTSWEVWLRGGPVEYSQPKTGIVTRYDSVGMQALVDTVRETGAKNIVVVGGLDWAYDLTGIAQGYEIDQRDGNGLIYDTHIYNWKSDWMGKVMVIADRHPILVGEFGADIRTIPGPGKTAEELESPYTWVPAMIGFMQENGLHWTAWSFHPRAGPHVVDTYHLTPTPYFGAFVRAALLGARFDGSQTR